MAMAAGAGDIALIWSHAGVNVAITTGMAGHRVAGVAHLVDVAGDADVIGICIVPTILVEGISPAPAQEEDLKIVDRSVDQAEVICVAVGVVTSDAVEGERLLNCTGKVLVGMGGYDGVGTCAIMAGQAPGIGIVGLE
jgi:hypothetical protein